MLMVESVFCRQGKLPAELFALATQAKQIIVWPRGKKQRQIGFSFTDYWPGKHLLSSLKIQLLSELSSEITLYIAQ